MVQYAFYFDNSRCTGCRTCEMACKDSKDLGVDITYRKVLDYEGGSWENVKGDTWRQNCYVYHISIACNHCLSPACVRVCPTRAMHKDDCGIVSVDAHICVGCGYCTMACPYHAPHISPVTRQSSKCDGCLERLNQGKQPICVQACPLRALEFDDIAKLSKIHTYAVRDLQPLPSSDYTSPNLLIKASDAANAVTKGLIEKGTIVNKEQLK